MTTSSSPTSSPTYTSELSLALRAVQRASILTKNVLRSLNNAVGAETKADDSPVTIADFAAQALIIAALHAVYPNDRFVGEESASALRKDAALAARVWELVRSAENIEAQNCDDGTTLARPKSVEGMLDVIDLGTTESTREGRVWVLDPIDGTATFMKGQQYAVCLCLLVDGVQQVGVIGCPNLKLDLKALGNKIREDHVDTEGFGVVLSAVKGHGTFVRGMHEKSLGEARRIQHSAHEKQTSELDFVESTLGKTSLSQPEHRAVAESFVAKWPGTQLWSLQLKYVALALGASDVMVRIPTGKDRFTFLWDHAGGQIVFQEAGGIIKDIDGGDIDMGQGRRLIGERNFGMVCAMPSSFNRVMQAVKKVLEKRATT